MTKKVLSLVLICVLSLGMIATAYAQDNLIIEVGSAESASPDTNVYLDINIKSNPGIAVIGFDIDYNSEYLTLSDVTHSNDVFKASDFTAGNIEAVPYKAIAFYASGNRTGNGNLMSLRFYINKNCPSGKYDVNISNIECYNINEEAVLCNGQSGSITVKGAEKPDEGEKNEDTDKDTSNSYTPGISGKPSGSTSPSGGSAAAKNQNTEKDAQKAPQKAYKAEKSIILTIGKKDAAVFGETIANDVAPILRKERTMLPARFVAEKLGAKVEWFESEEKVRITKDKTEILIYINSDTAYVNGEVEKLDSPAFLENDRTYTPLRFVAEKLGAKVYWEEDTQNVIIEKQ